MSCFDRCLVHRLAILMVLFSGVAVAQPADPTASPPAEPTPTPPPTPDPTPGPPPAPVPTPVPVVASPPEVPTEAEQEADVDYNPWTVRPGLFVQPQFRLRQDSPAPFDEDGFRLARARATMTASGKAGNLDLSAYFEAELQPTFTLFDAYATVSRTLPHKGALTLDVGQTRVPISRQQLLSDTRTSFPDKGQLSTIAPDRDLGARLWYVPSQFNKLRVIGSVFNGEGKNQVQNINQSYFYAGRIELTPIGTTQPYAESAFAGKWLSLGLSVGRNRLTPGAYREDVLYLGADLSGSYKGISGSFEYLEVRHTFSGDPANLPGVDYKANGWLAQVTYLLPQRLPPLHQSRFEVGARVEEIDRNDSVPIVMIGDPNQSQRIYTAVVSWYMRQHQLKAQLAASHFQEIEDQTAIGGNATYDNDQLLLQVTYRVE